MYREERRTKETAFAVDVEVDEDDTLLVTSVAEVARKVTVVALEDDAADDFEAFTAVVDVTVLRSEVEVERVAELLADDREVLLLVVEDDELVLLVDDDELLLVVEDEAAALALVESVLVTLAVLVDVVEVFVVEEVAAAVVVVLDELNTVLDLEVDVVLEDGLA